MAESGNDASKGPSHMGIEEKESKFTVNVLQLIKTAQGEHGVKHHDFARYRRYCTARLGRLYKSLKFKHGRGRYVKKPITLSIVDDVRFLHIILYSAERAWSYAMAMKQATTDGPSPNSRKRYHLMGRLAKAAKWADLFSRACAHKADPRTSLEAAAYAAFMVGSYLVEREQHWEIALTNFTRAKAIYEELGKYGTVENQVLCRRRLDDELEPNIRYCLYKMGPSNMDGFESVNLATQGTAGLDLFQGTVGLDLLQEQLEAVMADARSQQADGLTEMNWLGRTFSINSAKIRACISKGQRLEKGLTATTSLPLEKKLNVFEKIFTAYHDARLHIHEDLVMAGNAEDVKDNLNGLHKAISCMILQKTIDRNLLLVTITKNRMNKQQPRQHPKEEKHDHDKSMKPQELVRLYDLLIQNLSDLSDLATSGKENNNDEATFARDLDARKLVYQAERCFYLAQFFHAAGKHAEAYLLYHRAREYFNDARSKQDAYKYGDEVVLELRRHLEECRIQSCLIHALAISEASKLESSLHKGIALISLNDDSSTTKVQKTTGSLLERMDKYEPLVGLPSSKDPPQITHLPPPFQAVPCKPIVLDTASSAIVFPSLEGRLKKEDKKKSFFGFWQ